MPCIKGRKRRREESAPGMVCLKPRSCRFRPSLPAFIVRSGRGVLTVGLGEGMHDRCRRFMPPSARPRFPPRPRGVLEHGLRTSARRARGRAARRSCSRRNCASRGGRARRARPSRRWRRAPPRAADDAPPPPPPLAVLACGVRHRPTLDRYPRAFAARRLAGRRARRSTGRPRALRARGVGDAAPADAARAGRTGCRDLPPACDCRSGGSK